MPPSKQASLIENTGPRKTLADDGKWFSFHCGLFLACLLGLWAAQAVTLVFYADRLAGPLPRSVHIFFPSYPALLLLPLIPLSWLLRRTLTYLGWGERLPALAAKARDDARPSTMGTEIKRSSGFLADKATLTQSERVPIMWYPFSFTECPLGIKKIRFYRSKSRLLMNAFAEFI